MNYVILRLQLLTYDKVLLSSFEVFDLYSFYCLKLLFMKLLREIIICNGVSLFTLSIFLLLSFEPCVGGDINLIIFFFLIVWMFFRSAFDSNLCWPFKTPVLYYVALIVIEVSTGKGEFNVVFLFVEGRYSCYILMYIKLLYL